MARGRARPIQVFLARTPDLDPAQEDPFLEGKNNKDEGNDTIPETQTFSHTIGSLD